MTTLQIGLAPRQRVALAASVAVLSVVWLSQSSTVAMGEFDIVNSLGRITAGQLWPYLIKIANWLNSWFKGALALATLAAIGLAWMGATMTGIVAGMGARAAASWAYWW